MRALRILLIIAVVLGGLFVAADRLAVNFAEGEAAERLRTSEGLESTPDVSIKGFPFLTQALGGTLDEVEVSIDGYDANAGTGSGSGAKPVRIERLTARMSGVDFSGDFSSATARGATGTALVSYPELLKAARVEPVQLAPGVTARVVGLADGGDGKIAVNVEATVMGRKLPQPLTVTSSATVRNGEVTVDADDLPNLGVPVAEDKIREITDFRQRISDLPAGIELDKVEAAPDGVNISVKGSNVRLVG
ncbi:LmeA family phospholipid-binding protein [Streptomyces sp. JNUCC 64]